MRFKPSLPHQDMGFAVRRNKISSGAWSRGEVSEYKREEKGRAGTMLWDKKVELKSKEERTEVKARKDKDARQWTVPKDDRRYKLSGAEPEGRDELKYSKLMNENCVLISWSEKYLQALVSRRGLWFPTLFPDHVPTFGELLSKEYFGKWGKEGNDLTLAAPLQSS